MAKTNIQGVKRVAKAAAIKAKQGAGSAAAAPRTPGSAEYERVLAASKHGKYRPPKAAREPREVGARAIDTATAASMQSVLDDPGMLQDLAGVAGSQDKAKQVLESLLRLHIGMKTGQDPTSGAGTMASGATRAANKAAERPGTKEVMESKFPTTGKRLGQQDSEHKSSAGSAMLSGLFAKMGLPSDTSRLKGGGDPDSPIPMSEQTSAGTQQRIAIAGALQKLMGRTHEPFNARAAFKNLTATEIATAGNPKVRDLLHKVGPLSAHLSDVTDRSQREAVRSKPVDAMMKFEAPQAKEPMSVNTLSRIFIKGHKMAKSDADKAKLKTLYDDAVAAVQENPKQDAYAIADELRADATGKGVIAPKGMTSRQPSPQPLPTAADTAAARREALDAANPGRHDNLKSLATILLRQGEPYQGGRMAHGQYPEALASANTVPQVGLVGKKNTAVFLKGMTGPAKDRVITETEAGKQGTSPMTKVSVRVPGVAPALRQAGESQRSKWQAQRQTIAQQLESGSLSEKLVAKGKALLEVLDSKLAGKSYG